MIKRPVLRWHGGKFRLAPWIVSHFPPHRIYTEAFGGAASVLMCKTRSYAEIYNDLCGEVVNLFRVLRDKEMAESLRRALVLTPFSREEFLLAYEKSADPIEASRRLVVRCFMGFGSNAQNINLTTGFRANSNRSHTTPAHDWKNYPDFIPAFVDRLRGVVVENKPAEEILLRHDAEDALHYVDPPYPLSTRTDNSPDYNFEMTDEQHRRLAQVLRGLKGTVVLSGYACPLYDEELFPDWFRFERAAFADGALKRTEILWMNRCGSDLFLTTENRGAYVLK